MRVVSIVGARPQFVKVATLARSFDRHNSLGREPIDSIIVHTGQHYDAEMSDIFFEELVNPAVAQALASEAHVQTMVLSPIEGLALEERQRGDDYFTLMRMDLANLRTALGCT